MLDQLDPVFTCLSLWVQKAISYDPMRLWAWAKLGRKDLVGLHGTTEFTITRDKRYVGADHLVHTLLYYSIIYI